MDHVYIVVGQTGEYDCHNEWEVCAYLSEESANDHRDKANRWSRENGLSQYGHNDRFGVEHGNPYDANMAVDYTGTSYFTQSVELRGSVA